jgi:hypothetical protein
MAIRNPVPQIGIGAPKLIGSFQCLTPIQIQVVGPETLYLSDDGNAMGADDAGNINAFQFNQATGIYTLWWIGDLYAAGSSPFEPLIAIPGVNTGSGLKGQKLINTPASAEVAS